MFTVTAMTAADKNEVMNILQRTEEFSKLDISVAEEVIDDYLNTGTASGYNVIVARDEAGIKGYVSFGLSPLTDATWDLYWIAVHRELKGQGIGSKLINYVEEAVAQKKGRQIIVETSSLPSYELARRFYYHHQYQLVCRIQDYYASGDDKMIFLKVLG